MSDISLSSLVIRMKSTFSEKFLASIGANQESILSALLFYEVIEALCREIMNGLAVILDILEDLKKVLYLEV